MLKKDPRDTKDALEILKKPSAFWENDAGSLAGNQGGGRTVKGRGTTPLVIQLQQEESCEGASEREPTVG